LWGQGVGVGTISARHVITDTDLVFGAIENYYAKAWMELGIFGFICIMLLFIYLVVVGLRSAARIVNDDLRDAALVIVAMIIFIAYISTRGWPLDQDPMAYYFWVMVGVLFKLGKIGAYAATPAPGRTAYQRSGVRPSLAGR
jgi:O-antigen ligase